MPYLGQNFFPSVDAGQILMHVRTQVGTRIEESANQFADVQKAIRKIIPPAEIETMVDNIGFPISGINMTYNNTGLLGPQDGDIQISLKEDHVPTEIYVKALREQLPRIFPGMTFAFLPADIVNQILNFGAPAPIDLQIRRCQSEREFRLCAINCCPISAKLPASPMHAFSNRPIIRPSMSTSIAPVRNRSG